MKKLLLIAMLFCAVSCMNEDNDNSQSATVKGTLTTTLDGQQVYQKADQVVTFGLKDSYVKELYIHFKDVKFIEPMPAFNIEFNALPFTIIQGDETQIGSWIVNQSRWVPQIGGEPYESRAVNNLYVVYNNTTLNVQFDYPAGGDKYYHVTFVCVGNKPTEPEENE